MMLAMFISCCSCTNANEETDHVTFFKKLSSLLRNISERNALIIGGDMKAQIGKNKKNKFYLYNLSNRNK